MFHLLLPQWGESKYNDQYNAIFEAKTPCMDALKHTAPTRWRLLKASLIACWASGGAGLAATLRGCWLLAGCSYAVVQAWHQLRLSFLARNCDGQAHGTAVGLPSDADMGNSEVGHNALGAGALGWVHLHSQQPCSTAPSPSPCTTSTSGAFNQSASNGGAQGCATMRHDLSALRCRPTPTPLPQARLCLRAPSAWTPRWPAAGCLNWRGGSGWRGTPRAAPCTSSACCPTGACIRGVWGVMAMCVEAAVLSGVAWQGLGSV